MKLGIVTDSTSDLPSYIVEEHNIQVVPTVLILDGKEYADGIDITRAEFYTRLPALRTPPTTAAPSIRDFAAPYENSPSRRAVTISFRSTRQVNYQYHQCRPSSRTGIPK